MAIAVGALSRDGQQQSPGFGFGGQGASTRTEGTISIKAPVLQEFTMKNGIKSFKGDPIVGEEAHRILASYMAANEDRKFERFKTLVDILATQKDFTKKDRGLNPEESVEQRARRYVLGMVLGAINVTPPTIHVGGRAFAVSTFSHRVSYNPYELQAVLEGKRSIGSGNAILPTDTEGTMAGNFVIVSKDLLQKAVKYFVEKLKIRVQGNTLYANDMAVVSFTTADQAAKILDVVPSFNLDDLEVF